MTHSKISKVLIANRGEIALRVQRACDKLGLQSVMIASEPDKELWYARQAHELVVIGGAPARDSYLAVEKIVQTAIERKCDAVHPGYGFLSENADFAQAVEDAGLTFIGPSPDMIRILGDKVAARARALEYDVPMTPGSPGGLNDEELVAAAEKIGFPVIIKAVAGGGGRGMRIISSSQEMRELLPRARAEALKNFSNSDVYFEKYIINPRHVEVQVFGDAHGNLVHFGTRDCSTQRRHQKLVEEAPAPLLSPELREAIHTAALNVARSVNYRNAGTAEFLVKDGQFYFLEMNTRIQVEHPVSEIITGTDLVALQLMVAMGEPLPMSQQDIKFSGHAIEFRMYAEDPRANFSPARGRITSLKRPTKPWIREDYAYEEGDDVSLHYDAMMSKLIVIGDTRSEAISRSVEALTEYKVGGVATTRDFHRWLLTSTTFASSPLDINYVEREFSPTSLEDLLLRDIRDPLHRAGVGDFEVKEFMDYRSLKYGHSYTVEVIHRKGGFFEVTPILFTERGNLKARKRYRRASNGMKAALDSLAKEVLEVVAPEELFQGVSVK